MQTMRKLPSSAPPEKVILDLLERDIAAHPEQLQPITAEQMRRVQSLVGDVSVELDTPLPPDDA